MILEDIKSLLLEGVNQSHFPGAAFGICYKGGTKIHDYVGYMSLLPIKAKLEGNEIYDVASLTKVVSTTTLIMILIEQKRLSLETKVNQILKWFQFEDITVYDLLTHTSGLPADLARANTLKDRDDVLSRIKNLELKYQKGEHIVYSDIGFILLGLMVETITKKSLNENGQELIFKPLLMHDTSYYPDIRRCAPTETRDDDVYQGLLCGRVHDEKAFALGESGHAGLFSTVPDLLKFIDAILNNYFVLPKETIDLLFRVQQIKPDLNQNTLKRALGWDKPTSGSSAGDNRSFAETILHTGFTGCNMFIDRKDGVGFVMLSNAVHPKRTLNQIIGYRRKIGNMIVGIRER